MNIMKLMFVTFVIVKNFYQMKNVVQMIMEYLILLSVVKVGVHHVKLLYVTEHVKVRSYFVGSSILV